MDFLLSDADYKQKKSEEGFSEIREMTLGIGKHIFSHTELDFKGNYLRCGIFVYYGVRDPLFGLLACLNGKINLKWMF